MPHYIQRVAIAAVLLASLAVLSACGRQAPLHPPVQPHGVITLAPHITETVFALGQAQRVVAIGSFCDYPPEATSLPRVGGYLDPDFEKIASLNPELIIAPGKHQVVTDFAAMKGIRVLNVNMDSFSSIDAGIETIGKNLACENEATALRQKITHELDAVRQAVNGLPRPKTLIINMRHSHDLNTLYTANHTSFVSELVDAAGGTNVYADASSTYLEASKETVVVNAPEVILEFHAGEKLSPEEQAHFIEDWKQLPSLPAVQNARIYLILQSHALRPGPRVPEIARHIARLLHPHAKVPEP